jgi:hypothetical protein
MRPETDALRRQLRQREAENAQLRQRLSQFETLETLMRLAQDPAPQIDAGCLSRQRSIASAPPASKFACRASAWPGLNARGSLAAIVLFCAVDATCGTC